jgi:hypothetical protein
LPMGTAIDSTIPAVRFYHVILYKLHANKLQPRWLVLGQLWQAGFALSGNLQTPKGPYRMVETTSGRFRTMTVSTVGACLLLLEIQM